MRVLIISDTHGKTSVIDDVLKKVGDINMLIHLGDIEGDLDFLRKHANCEIHAVRGNNDWGVDLPDEEEFMIRNLRVYITHGHRHSVYYGTERLQQKALYGGYDIVMYGHTHMRKIEHFGNITILNPGSLALPRDGREGKFVIMDFDQHGKPFFSECQLEREKSKNPFGSLW